jgi:hypothetical protein
MGVLGRPAVVACLGVLFSGILHPAVHAREWLSGTAVLMPALALLLVLGLLTRARADRAARGVGLGAALLLAALAFDGARGRRGSLTLAGAQALNRFEEEGPEGRPLGLRPLGFEVGLAPSGPGTTGLRLRSRAGEETVELREGRAVGRGGFRLSDPRAVPTGEAVRLTIGIEGGEKRREVEVRPEEPGLLDGQHIALERYFPDFALDEKGQPLTRSLESKNPAALLQVEEGGKTRRVFVMRALPGVHGAEGRSFSLLFVEPEVSVRIEVAREPAAPLAACGLVLLGAGLALGLRRP